MASTAGQACSKPILQDSFKASGDLSSYQYHFVYLSASNTVSNVGASTTIPLGVLQDKPDAAGESALVMLEGITMVELGGTVSRNTYVMSHTDATAVTATNGKPCAGLALEDGVDGDIIPVLLTHGVWSTIS